MPPSTRRGRHAGLLIAVEGCDGSGKSTQLRLLHRHLGRIGLMAHLSAWNSSPSVHPLVRRAKRERRLSSASYALLNAADFADRYEREILPRLRLGGIVLCDRYVGTAYARDPARGLDPTWVERLYAFARPADLTFLFHLPVDVAAKRLLHGRDSFGYYEAGLDQGLSDDPLESFLLFQGRVLHGYEAIAERMGYVVIDAGAPLRVQQRTMRAHAHAVLGRRVPS